MGLIPVAIGAGGASLVLRSRLRDGFLLRDPFVDALLAYSVLLVAYLVFSPQTQSLDDIELEPGSDVLTALRAEPGDTLPWIELVGNFLLLLPIGALIPLRLPWFDRVFKIMLAGFLAACTIEAIQFLAVSGRVVSTDDILLNTIGATFGGALGCPLLRLRTGRAVAASEPGHDPIVEAYRAQHSCPDGAEPTVWRIIAKIEAERRRNESTGRHRLREREIPRPTRRRTSSLPTSSTAVARRPHSPARHPRPPESKTVAPQRSTVDKAGLVPARVR